MPERYPGYDVLRKRNSPSWNNQTRAVIDERLAIDPNGHRFFTDDEWPTIRAICDRIVPQTVARPRPVPLAAMVDEKLLRAPARDIVMRNCRPCGRLGARSCGARRRGQLASHPSLSRTRRARSGRSAYGRATG